MLIAGAVICLLFEPVVLAMHSVAGLVFAALVGPHLWHRRAWIRVAARRARLRRRLPPGMRAAAAQAVLLAALVTVVTVSGLWDWLGTPTRIRVHALSSIALTVLLCWHGWTRRRLLRRHRAATATDGPSRQPPAARRPGDRQQRGQGAAGVADAGSSPGQPGRGAGWHR